MEGHGPSWPQGGFCHEWARRRTRRSASLRGKPDGGPCSVMAAGPGKPNGGARSPVAAGGNRAMTGPEDGRDGARPSREQPMEGHAPSWPPHGGPWSLMAAGGNRAMTGSKDGRDGARPSRKSPVHYPVTWKSHRPSILFLTVCSPGRRRLYDKADVHALLRQAWQEASTWHVGRYVLMPDHVHLFCAPSSSESPPVANWVRYWKSWASRRWPRPMEHPVWQKSFWDTQLRNGESYEEKWLYVRENPVRAGLCHEPGQWPFQGEMEVLVWDE